MIVIHSARSLAIQLNMFVKYHSIKILCVHRTKQLKSDTCDQPYYPPGQGLGGTQLVFLHKSSCCKCLNLFFSDVESSQVVLTQTSQLQFLFGILKWLFEFKDSFSFTGWYHSIHSHTPFQHSKDQSCYILIISVIFYSLPQFQKLHVIWQWFHIYPTPQNNTHEGGWNVTSYFTENIVKPTPVTLGWRLSLED